MAGACILIIGARGSGKSTTLKNRIGKKVNKNACLVWDPNKEHTDLYTHKPFTKFFDFTEKLSRIHNAVAVVEEATVYLNNRGHNFDVQEFLVQSRHHGNTVFLMYHSFRAIPQYIFDMADYAIVHKTNDSADGVWDKFKHETLLAAFNEIKSAEWIDSGKKRSNGTPIFYSPHKIIPIY